jgi:hypothetical protein
MTSASKTTTSTKRALKDVSSATSSQEGSTKKPRTTEQDEEKQRKQMNGVIRKVQGQINAKLKWKNSFKPMKNNSELKKGGRVEVVCNDPAVFEKIFDGATIKKGKDGKLSCSFKTDDEVEELKFHGTDYRFNCATLRAPCSASLKDSALVFSFKFSIC